MLVEIYKTQVMKQNVNPACFYFFVRKRCARAEKLILTSEQHVRHLPDGQNTQQAFLKAMFDNVLLFFAKNTYLSKEFFKHDMSLNRLLLVEIILGNINLEQGCPNFFIIK